MGNSTGRSDKKGYVEMIFSFDNTRLEKAQIVKDFFKERGWTRAQLAKAAGISTSALSLLVNGKEGQVGEKILQRILDTINRENEKVAIFANEREPFIETSASRRFFDIAKMCHLFSEIGACYSDPGHGKTVAVHRYADLHQDAILIEADPGYSASTLFKEIRQRLNISTFSKLQDLFNESVKRLGGSGRLIIVDEAEQLQYQALEYLRRLHDKARVGILLVGTPKLLSNLCGINGEYSQLYSRVGIAVKLEPLTNADTKEIIQRLLPEASHLHDRFHVESGANARRLFKLIKRTIHVSEINATKINRDVINTASRLLKVEQMY